MVVIFYNIYLPTKEEEDRGRMVNERNETDFDAQRYLIIDAPKIFKEQLAQVRRYARSHFSTPIKVYYNTIGQEGILPKDVQKDICQEPNLDCIHMHHYDQGQEDLTLQNLYEYCQQPPPPQQQLESREDTRRVAYLHAKGSFHKTLYNNKNRVTVTFSVLNKCLDILGNRTMQEGNAEAASGRTCDACGGMFLPIWGPFFSTNMWAAQCSYINKLIPPRDFAHRMQKMHETLWGENASAAIMAGGDASMLLQTRTTTIKPLLRFNMMQDIGPYCMGTGRYGSEHWVASHPSLRPCDARGVRLGTPVAPRQPLTTETVSQLKLLNVQRILRVLQNEQLRWREYFLLPGYLYRTTFLYQTLPPPNSWVWSWFPDGDMWRAKAVQYGLNVVNAFLNHSTTVAAVAVAVPSRNATNQL